MNGDLEVRVIKRGVGQTVTEGVVHLQPAGVEPAVADVYALAVAHMAEFAGKSR
jgi:hypothetical protein